MRGRGPWLSIEPVAPIMTLAQTGRHAAGRAIRPVPRAAYKHPPEQVRGSTSSAGSAAAFCSGVRSRFPGGGSHATARPATRLRVRAQGLQTGHSTFHGDNDSIPTRKCGPGQGRGATDEARGARSPAADSRLKMVSDPFFLERHSARRFQAPRAGAAVSKQRPSNAGRLRQP
ncbi:MAG: hypothetical protein OHK0044_15310 [Burkholderiaceae bacterium]